MMIYLYKKVKERQEKAKSSSPAAPTSPSKPACAHQAQTSGLVVPRTSASWTREAPNALTQPQIQISPNGKCLECKDERRAARVYRWKIILGLVFPFALQNLDVTIIASALPWIASDFGEVSQLNWIISAFNLTSAAFIPFWGQMTDIFGRHHSLQACIILMMIGSALCTGAPTDAFPVLLLGRGFQGLGCAGIGVIVKVILADKVSLKENAKNWSIFAFVGGCSYGLGPVIGGYLTRANWRWCFGINLPIAFVAVLVVFFVLREELLGPQPLPGLDETGETGPLSCFSTRMSTIDFGGQIFFLFAFGLMILAFTWAGATYDWNTAAVLVPLCVGVVLSVVFICWEYLMSPGKYLNRKWPWQKSVVPWKVMREKDIGLLFYINFATGAAMYAVFYFLDLYFTLVKGKSAEDAGVQLLFYTPGLGVGAYASMYMCNVFPRKTWIPIMLGSLVEAAGIGALAWAIYSEKTSVLYGMMALTGAGTGLRFMPGSLHAIGIFPDHIATVVSLMSLALPFGGTVALTVMATVFNNTSGISNNSPLRDFDTLKTLPKDMLDYYVHKAKMGIVWSFVAITPFMALCIIAVMFLGNVNITKQKANEGRETSRDRAERDIYLLRLLRRSRQPSGDTETELQEEKISPKSIDDRE
ncbi:MFS general substrate transporter [Pleurostoma richardsiae]|uniref:MFS general substrate transporter n=1 Tax=Pleurostoma richardsiae TaxID=41990 RepID=A0AA38R3N1_9PEZI|nr:MFS general substrate transporter [Pleurostoma richardsiae]